MAKHIFRVVFLLELAQSVCAGEVYLLIRLIPMREIDISRVN
jgi:hypothetical protein